MDSLLELSELVKAVKGKLISKSENCFFSSVQTDSRLVEKDTMFVPLIGEFQDGHKYIEQAVEKGASVVLMSESTYETSLLNLDRLPVMYPFVTFILVENTLHALQDAAEAYVEKMSNDLIKVSITGSCGKTTTKEMMVSVAKEHFGENHTVYTKGNFNSETGLPLSVFNIRKEHEIGIFEMGMNRENEIGEISKVLKSKYGIITNIGTAHIGLLGSRENIAKEKRKSFNYIPKDGAAFVPADDDFVEYLTENVEGNVVTYGKNVPEEKSGVHFIKDKGLEGTEFSVDGIKVNLPLNGEYNYQNALGVVACAKHLGITADEIRKGLEGLGKISGRMESKKVSLCNDESVTLIEDCYNANPDSMSKAIDFCNGLNDGRKFYVLADMKELGSQSESAHKMIGEKLKGCNFESVFLVGNEIEPAYKALKENKEIYYYKENSEETFNNISKKLNELCKKDDVILLKGSHSMELEKLVPMLCREGKVGK